MGPTYLVLATVDVKNFLPFRGLRGFSPIACLFAV
jgi:hypothetical protein